ncbi:mlck, drome [Anopheles darlingi]|uniref:non-specific serine/threonine protein kinase n=1 Tax=Anopheles darlingi TaxID=43151 RepID=W5JT99_ANODA|nr:mlck, drome [Anopheles darlingi]
MSVRSSGSSRPRIYQIDSERGTRESIAQFRSGDRCQSAMRILAVRWLDVGKYGILRRAVCKKSGVKYAAKFLRRRRRGQCCQKEINHEIAVLMLCSNSQHIVRLHAVHDTRLETALILELANGGELQTLIDEKGMLSEAKTRICMRDILRAVQHMHRQSVAHLDLKPQNILLTGDNVEDGLKLCDFGIARLMDDTHTIHDIIGTPDYVAPEVLHYEPLTLQTDIWSIGVLAYVLLTGYTPFGGETKQETFLNITKCSLTFPEDMFEGVSSEAIDFIRRALRIRPRERMTVDECLAHPWMVESPAPITQQPQAQQQDEKHLSSHDEMNGCSTDDRHTEELLLVVARQEANEDNKENLAHNASNSTTCVGAAAGQAGVIASQSINGNGANPAIVSRALFPDAPTTPKVSRKASPTDEQLQQQQHRSSTRITTGTRRIIKALTGVAKGGGGGDSGGCEIVPVMGRTSGGLAGTLSAPLNVRPSHSATASTTVTTTTTASVKVFVQKFQSLQQQHPADEVMVAGQGGDCPSAGSAATVPSAVCIATTNAATTATVLVAAPSAAASLSTATDVDVEDQLVDGNGGADDGSKGCCGTDGALCGHDCSDSSAHHPHQQHNHHLHHPHHNHHHPHHHHRHRHHHHHQPLQSRDPDTIIC